MRMKMNFQNLRTGRFGLKRISFLPVNIFAMDQHRIMHLDSECCFSERVIMLFLLILFSLGEGLVVRVLGYRSGGPGSIPGTTKFSVK
jgi:hypothetical protein